MEFPCTQCGQCCRNIQWKLDNTVGILRELADRFPYDVNSDGSCSMLQENGTCSVYEDRPILCNLKKMSLIRNIPEKEYYIMVARVCNDLIEEGGLDTSYLVKF